MSIEFISKSIDKIEAGIHSVKNTQQELAERVLYLEQRGATSPLDRQAAAVESVGARVTRSFADNAELFAKTKSLRLELKAASDPITSSSGRTIASGGVGFVQGGVLGLQNALVMRPAAGTTLEYSRYTGQQGEAAVQGAEGDAKAAIRPDHILIQQPALTVAGWAKMSRQALGDSAELRRAVDVTLARSAAKALDAALVTGATGFTGGYAGLTTAISALYDTLADAVAHGKSVMQEEGFVPDAVAMRPSDWLNVTISKGSDGHYLSGDYLGTTDMMLRGLRVILSPTVAAGTALVMDTSHSELLMVDTFSIEIGYTGDDFTRNLAVLLGEMRVIPVMRTSRSIRSVTTTG